MFKNSKTAAQGVGTLILFIAIILIALTAALVLVQTGNILQAKSLDTSNQVEEKLVSGVEIVQVSLEDVSDGVLNQTTDSMFVSARIEIGSKPVNLDDLFLTLSTSSSSYFFEINQGGALTASEFNVTYLSNAGVPRAPGYLLQGDFVSLEILAPQDIIEEEIIYVGVTGSNLKTLEIQTKLPSAMVQSRVRVFP